MENAAYLGVLKLAPAALWLWTRHRLFVSDKKKGRSQKYDPDRMERITMSVGKMNTFAL